MLRRAAASVYINLSSEPWQVPLAAGDDVWIQTVSPDAASASETGASATSATSAGAGILTLAPDSAAVTGPA